MSRVVGLTAAAADSVAHIEVALVWSEDMARQGQCSRVFCGVPVYLNAIASLDTYCPLRAHLSLGAVHVRPLRVQCCCSQSSAASVNRADFSSSARAPGPSPSAGGPVVQHLIAPSSRSRRSFICEKCGCRHVSRAGGFERAGHQMNAYAETRGACTASGLVWYANMTVKLMGFAQAVD